MSQVVMVMHVDRGSGTAWAATDAVPGFTAAAGTTLGVMALVDECVQDMPSWLGVVDVDLRWRWCDPRADWLVVGNDRPLGVGNPDVVTACQCSATP